MTDPLPAPLIAPEVDLRDFDFMPFYGARLFGSDTWIEADSDAKVAALRLWWASWHQEPAGSLPDNDRLLADLAGYGVAVSAFAKVKAAAMRGWIKCADGRLYHPVICQIAAKVWRDKRKKATENEAERARKARKRGQRPAAAPAETPPVSAPQSGGSPTVSGRTGGDCPADGGVETALKGSRREGEEEPPVVPRAGGPVPADNLGAGPGPGSGATGERPALELDPGGDDLDTPLNLDRTDWGDTVKAWNAMAAAANEQHGRVVFSAVQKLTKARCKAITARLKDVGGLAGMKLAFERVAASPRLRGEQNGREHATWRADFDWILLDRNFTRLMEGHFDDRQNPGRTTEFRNGFAALLAEAERLAETRGGGRVQPDA